jgi:malonyl CoA-acyl carrier protein transacylase/phosphopantetheinyl transferase
VKQNAQVHDWLEGELVLIGAPDDDALPRAVARVSAFVDAAPAVELRDVALTCGLEAGQAGVVAALVADSLEDLAAKLAFLRRKLAESPRRVPDRKGVYLTRERLLPAGRIAFLFPGEGSQYPDMLRDVCLHFPECRAAFDEADEACEAAGGTALPGGWVFPAGTAARGALADEAVGLPEGVLAALAADTACMRLFGRLGIRSDGAAGPGIGEIAALECAGVLDFATREARVKALGQGYALLREVAAKPGVPETVLLSVGGVDRGTVADLVRAHPKDAWLIRENSPTQHGLCARSAAAEEVVRRCSEAGGVVRAVPVNRPCHTPWFEPALPRLAEFTRRWARHAPRIPVYSCALAAPLPLEPRRLPDPCARQWVDTVRFEATIERLYADGFRVFVELGARGSLTAFVDEILHRRPHLAVAANRVHRDSMQQVHHALGALAAHGVRFDPTPLHARRGSRRLDLNRPSAVRPRADRARPLPCGLPTLSAAGLPENLGLPAAGRAASLPDLAAAPARPPAFGDAVPVDTGRTDFPILAGATVLQEHPGERIVLRLSVALADQPCLADCTLGAAPVSLSDPALRGLMLLPLALCAEIMAEAARRLAPARVVSGLRELQTDFRFTVEDTFRLVRVTARRVPTAGASLAVACEIGEDVEGDAPADRAALASATVLLDDRYPAPEQPPAFALHCPHDVAWQEADLYPGRLFVGPHLRALRSVSVLGDNGIAGEACVLPRGELLRGIASPRFSVDPFLLMAVPSALSVWHGRETGSEAHVLLSHRAASVRFTQPPRSEGARLRVLLAARPPAAGSAAADAWLVDDAGKLACEVRGWEAKRFAIGTAFARLLFAPPDGFLTRAVPAELLPALPQEVVCCMAGGLPPGLLEGDQELWLKVAAGLTLSLTERIKWREMGGSTARRVEWLMGRVAAKDAVRRCLLARYGRKWAAPDVRIETAEAGKPRPEGEWRKRCGARMDISITHTPDMVVAAAAPNAFIGIDVERRDRELSDGFIAAAFSPHEQELAAETGEGPTALIRIWCAKEALAKALGTGLRYGASDLQARAYDRATGRVELELTRLWTEAFPHLKGQGLAAHTALFDNRVLSVCVLPTDIVKDGRP